MVPDTGSSNLWVYSSKCYSIPCWTHTTFKADKSSTYKKDGKAFDITYGSGAIKGTLAWKAPEEFDDEPFSQKSDVYSFAIVIWEMMTREKPFKGQGANEITINAIQGYRPEFDEATYKELYGRGMVSIMKWCWSPFF